jgi:hypothetical protein
MSEPTESDVEVAQRAYRAGHVSFEEADYRRSLLYWEDAFRRDCTAVNLLLSLARAYELSGDQASAALALETYLKRVPETEKRPSIEKRIARLRSEPDAQSSPATPHAQQEPATSANTNSTRKPIWPILVTGAGVTLALVGHGILQSARQEAIDLGCDLSVGGGIGTCPSDEATAAASSARTDAQRVGIPLAVTGHVLGAAGGVLWYYFWTRPAKKSSAQLLTSFEPVVSANYQGLNFNASF